MTFDNRNCFTCGEPGHLSASCPTRQTLNEERPERPPWCGMCEATTRLIDHGDYMQRCPDCWAWPAKGTHRGEMLPQHRRCGGCRQVIYEWDQGTCDRHIPLPHRPMTLR